MRYTHKDVGIGGLFIYPTRLAAALQELWIAWSNIMHKLVLFLHIPKAGGSTLQSCIYDAVHHGLVETGTEQPEPGGAVLEAVYFYPIGFFKHPGSEPPDHIRHAV